MKVVATENIMALVGLGNGFSCRSPQLKIPCVLKVYFIDLALLLGWLIRDFNLSHYTSWCFLSW